MGEGHRSLRTGVPVPVGRVCTPDPNGSVGLIRANRHVRSERHEQFEYRYANSSHRPMRMARMPPCERFACLDTNGSYRAVRVDLSYLDFAEPLERVPFCGIAGFCAVCPRMERAFRTVAVVDSSPPANCLPQQPSSCRRNIPPAKQTVPSQLATTCCTHVASRSNQHRAARIPRPQKQTARRS